MTIEEKLKDVNDKLKQLTDAYNQLIGRKATLEELLKETKDE